MFPNEDTVLSSPDHAGVHHEFMDWADCARLCKGPPRPDLTHIRFDWGPGSHVLRRFLSTSALPNLREISVLVASFSGAPLQLFKSLRTVARPLQAMHLITTADLGRRRRVQFTIVASSEDELKVHVTELTALREDDVPTLADGFGLTPYLCREPWPGADPAAARFFKIEAGPT